MSGKRHWSACSREQTLRPDDGSAGRRGRRPEDGDDRRDLSQGALHGDQAAVEKGRPSDRRGRLIGRSSRGMVIELMTAGQVRDHMCPAALPGNLPKAEWLLADRGHDANWFEEV